MKTFTSTYKVCIVFVYNPFAEFFSDEYISHFTIREGGLFCENVHLNKLNIHTVKTDAKRLGIHSAYTNRNRRWDELNGWQKPDKERWPVGSEF